MLSKADLLKWATSKSATISAREIMADIKSKQVNDIIPDNLMANLIRNWLEFSRQESANNESKRPASPEIKVKTAQAKCKIEKETLVLPNIYLYLQIDGAEVLNHLIQSGTQISAVFHIEDITNELIMYEGPQYSTNKTLMAFKTICKSQPKYLSSLYQQISWRKLTTLEYGNTKEFVAKLTKTINDITLTRSVYDTFAFNVIQIPISTMPDLQVYSKLSAKIVQSDDDTPDLILASILMQVYASSDTFTPQIYATDDTDDPYESSAPYHIFDTKARMKLPVNGIPTELQTIYSNLSFGTKFLRMADSRIKNLETVLAKTEFEQVIHKHIPNVKDPSQITHLSLRLEMEKLCQCGLAAFTWRDSMDTQALIQSIETALLDKPNSRTAVYDVGGVLLLCLSSFGAIGCEDHKESIELKVMSWFKY